MSPAQFIADYDRAKRAEGERERQIKMIEDRIRELSGELLRVRTMEDPDDDDDDDDAAAHAVYGPIPYKDAEIDAFERQIEELEWVLREVFGVVPCAPSSYPAVMWPMNTVKRPDPC